MTIDELYSFCLQNNLFKFDKDKFGEEFHVEMAGNFEQSDDEADKHKEGLIPFVSKAFHDKTNLNASCIETDVFEENLPSSHFRPVLAHIVKDEETGELDFGSHDIHIEEVVEVDQDGNEVKKEKTVYDEQPIGVIDGTRNGIEYDEEADVNRAVLHGYLYEGYCQDAVDILNRRGVVNCSVELAIRDFSFDSKKKVLILDDFYVSGLTLLSAKTKPGMKGSDFKIEDFSAHYENDKSSKEMMEELAMLVSEIIKNNSEGGNKETMFETLLEKYGKTVEDVTFEYEGLTDEELEAKFEEMFGEKEPDRIKKCSVEVAGETITYETSMNEIIYALERLVNETYRNDETYYGVKVYDSYVVMHDYWNDKYYKQEYESTEEDVYSLIGDRVELFVNLLTKEEEDKLNEIRATYEELKTFKENVETEQLNAQKSEILNDSCYESISETEEFETLKSNLGKYSLEDLQVQADLILAKSIKEAKKTNQPKVLTQGFQEQQATFLDNLLAKSKKGGK